MSLLTSLIPALSREETIATANVQAPSVRPDYVVRETADAYSVQVFLPGVAKEALEITADATELRVVGRRVWKKPEAWTALYAEGTNANYELVLAHAGDIEAGAISAELADGVLSVTVPKTEAVKPRRVEVK